MQTTRQVADEATGYAGPLADGHWLYAATLQAGDRLLNADGTWAEVMAAETVNQPLLAYNLTVEGFHTYFVAANEDAAPVWVHDACYFGSPAKLDDHFNRHGADFGADSRTEYQEMALDFLTKPTNRAKGDYELIRTNGDVVRYNSITEEFAVLTNGGIIKTYYIPDPAIHGYATNLDYFYAQQR